MRNAISRLVLPALLASSLVASTQQPAPAPPAGSNWAHVQALPPNTYLHVNAKKSHAICYLTAVDAESLSCSKDTGVGHAQVSFQRSEITTIKLARRGRSAVLGGTILGGAGAIAGAVQGSRSNYYAVKGAWAMIYGFSGMFAGAPLGYLTDFSASTIYRAEVR
jgi:hypothetical protein